MRTGGGAPDGATVFSVLNDSNRSGSHVERAACSFRTLVHFKISWQHVLQSPNELNGYE